MHLHNIRAKKEQRRELRSRLTPEESYLWSYLQRRQLCGWKFRRQHSVGPYILDFYCPAEKLAVELDGSTHDHEAAQNYDLKRNAFLTQFGIRTLRFENREARKNIEGVLLAIEAHFAELTTPALRATPPR